MGLGFKSHVFTYFIYVYVCGIKQFRLSDKHLYPLTYLANLVLGVCIRDRVSLYNPGCPGTCRDPPTSAPQVLRSVYHYAWCTVAFAL